MGDGIGISRNQEPRWDDRDRFGDSSLTNDGVSHSPSVARARTPSSTTAAWASDRAIPEAVRNYDPSMFANPALRGAAQPPATTPSAVTAPRVAVASASTVAREPDPLPAAADAYRGIHLYFIAENLPAMTRTDATKSVRAGAYTLQPQMRAHDDGSSSLVYWVAVNREMKRAEFVVGPDSLETFKQNAGMYENAGATAYMNGEPNAWQRLSQKAVDDAMAKGAMAAGRTLVQASVAAVQDPSWWGQNLLAVSTALAAGAPAARPAGAAAAEESAAARSARAQAPAKPGQHTPIAEGGGLGAHEGGPPRAHLIKKHVGQTPADLEARMARSPGMSSNSSFYNRAQAEAAAAKTLASNEGKIAEWMRSSPKATLEVEYHPQGPSFPVGTHMARGAEAVPVAGVRLVLLKDATMSSGFRILTGFPIP